MNMTQNKGNFLLLQLVTKKGTFWERLTLPTLSKASVRAYDCRTQRCYFKFSHLFCLVFVATASMYCYCLRKPRVL